jgi:FixJ family two-component response regulator
MSGKPTTGKLAIELLRQGVMDYLVKPAAKDALMAAVTRAMKWRTTLVSDHWADWSEPVGHTEHQHLRRRGERPENLRAAGRAG